MWCTHTEAPSLGLCSLLLGSWEGRHAGLVQPFGTYIQLSLSSVCNVSVLKSNTCVFVFKDNWTALIAASKEGHVHIVGELLGCGADPEHRDMVCAPCVVCGGGGAPPPLAASDLVPLLQLCPFQIRTSIS